ncbi:metallophosphoesterase [Bacillus paralicheniformis]|uniref:metallophosphoesterase n=1 Tax=Bacillus paralicheniformis TaxID=1648923 RepID=UPI002E21E9F4|nr:metallophosphoesterase [Bacillus paralicheniformis]MED1219278.1 metallophosphoesterase [Bacillus paralicheniformis]
MKKYRNRQTLLFLAAVLLFALQIPISSAAEKEHIQLSSPAIRHTSVEQVKKGDDLYFSAEAAADTVILYYKQHAELPYRGIPMEVEPGKQNGYIAKLESESIASDKVQYYIEAQAGRSSVKTDVYTVALKGVRTDTQKLPELLITEMAVDTSNTGAKDGYEFIEVYNNTNKAVHLNNYKMKYRHPEKGKESDNVWPFERDDVAIPSGQTHVFWVKNRSNGHLTEDDFNQHYGVHLREGKTLSVLKGSGLANTAPREVIICTNSGEEVASARYQSKPDKTDVTKNKALLYRYPLDGTKHMKMISAGEETPSPGSLLKAQVPSQTVTVMPDREKPAIHDMTDHQAVKPGETIQLLADMKDNRQVKQAQFFYRMNDDEPFTEVRVEKSRNDGLYRHNIYFAELIGKEKVEYYMRAGDGSNVTATEKKTIPLEQRILKGLRLNVSEGGTVSGKMLLKATAEKPPFETTIRIDGIEQKKGESALEKKAYFAFDVNQTNLYFKNAITIGRRVQKVFDDSRRRYTTITVPVSPEEFKKGKPFAIKVRSGTKSTPFEQSAEENRDDFVLKNPRLILADGTIIRDEQYDDPKAELPAGDGPGAREWYEFRFSIPEAKFTSLASQWHTHAWDEGPHIVEAENGEERLIRRVTVDNTGPEIKTSLKDGRTYKGSFEINAVAHDKWSGVKSIKAVLDGKKIALPYFISSAGLDAGKHELKIKAEDSAGNLSIVKKAFYIKEEKPEKPSQVKNTPGSTQAKLAVRVKDPTKDKMKVSFHQGFQYTVKDEEHVDVSANESGTEPPQSFAVRGEKALTKEERSGMSAPDGKGFETSSTTKFPYHRFDVKVDENTGPNDKVEVRWRGSSLPGRKVSMFAWNWTSKRWETLTFHVAKDEKPFTLKGSIKAADYIRQSKASIIIQDQIQLSQNDYTFVWMSDTQYYSESYPHIFERQVKWIAEQKDKLNIQYVFHTGDLVDEADQPLQWKRADQFMKVLDDHQVPYGVLAGNHDVSHKDRSYLKFGRYFGERRFKQKPHYGGSYQNNKGHYDLISSGGNDYIMVSMGWGIGKKELQWIDDVLKRHPDRKAILSFHEFLLVSGSRSPIGEKIFEQIIKRNPNVIAVLSGHYHSSNLKVDRLDDNGDGKPDRKVYQMLADYQGGPEGGQGYLRILHVDPKHDTIHVKTYSPYLDDYNFYDPHQFGPKDEFNIKTDLKPRKKKVKTDYFELNVFSNKEIGKAKTVKSGKTASVTWKDLQPNTTYFWYAAASDHYGGKSRSQMWKLTTKDDGMKSFLIDQTAGVGSALWQLSGSPPPAGMKLKQAKLEPSGMKNPPIAVIGFWLAAVFICERKKHLFS